MGSGTRMVCMAALALALLGATGAATASFAGSSPSPTQAPKPDKAPSASKPSKAPSAAKPIAAVPPQPVHSGPATPTSSGNRAVAPGHSGASAHDSVGHALAPYHGAERLQHGRQMWAQRGVTRDGSLARLRHFREERDHGHHRPHGPGESGGVGDDPTMTGGPDSDRARLSSDNYEADPASVRAKLRQAWLPQ